VAAIPPEVPLNYKTQPPWEFLLSASSNSLQSYELSRLNHAANLRKEITQLLDTWMDENASALLARWLMRQRELPVAEEAAANGDGHSKAVQAVSDNFLADQPVSPHETRDRK
jgi:hypothetical protein